MSRFACPTCGGQFEVAAENLGKTVRCPHCSSVLGTSSQQPNHGGTPERPIGPAQHRASPGQQPDIRPGGEDLPDAQPTEQQPAAPPLVGYGYPGVAGAATEPNPAGTLSFVLALLYYVAQCGLLGVLVSRVGTGPDAQQRLRMMLMRISAHPPGWLIAFGMITLIMLIVSFVLGLYAATRPNRRKGLAVAGVVMSGLGLLCGFVNLFGGGT